MPRLSAEYRQMVRDILVENADRFIRQYYDKTNDCHNLTYFIKDTDSILSYVALNFYQILEVIILKILVLMWNAILMEYIFVASYI